MEFKKQKLPNGLQIVGEVNPSARSMALGYFVRTGSRDETSEVAGVSHFLEHMVFKGTPRRTALDVNREFDAIGAHYNAYTSEENTVFHAAVLPEYMPNIVDILSDILRPSLRDEDFDMEKNVIIEEIGMYDDQPQWAAYEEAKKDYFGKHPMASSVLGSVASITALKRDQMHEYFQRRYVAPNISVVAAGNFDWQHLVDLVTEKCGHWESGPVPRKLEAAHGGDRLRVVTKEQTAQEHMFLLSDGPAADSDLRYSAEILSCVIGDDTGSRLYWELVDQGILDTASTSYHEYDATGTFYTFLSGEPERAQEALNITKRVFDDLQKNGITEEELAVARSKLGSRIVRGGEKPMGRMQTLGFYWVYLNTYYTVDDDLRDLNAVSLESVRKLLDQFPINKCTTLALGPLEKLTPAS